MKRIWHLCALAVLSLPLIIAISGCGQLSQETDYTIVNGKEQKCTPPTTYSDVGKGKFCGFPFYVRLSWTDGTTKLSECDTFTSGQFGLGLECSEVTPNASNSQPTTQTQCTPNWVYDQVSEKGTAWYVVDRVLDTNPTNTPSQAKLVATTSKTVTVTDAEDVTKSLGVSIDGLIVDTITASVQTRINNSVSQSVAVTIGNEIAVPLPAHQTVHAIYGAKVQLASGHLYDPAKCEPKWDYGTDLTTVPYAVGWYYWYDGDIPPTTVN